MSKNKSRLAKIHGNKSHHAGVCKCGAVVLSFGYGNPTCGQCRQPARSKVTAGNLNVGQVITVDLMQNSLRSSLGWCEIDYNNDSLGRQARR